MSVLGALWWLVLGLLMGWIGLWLFDRLMLRDGEVAGLRAARELAEAEHRFADERAELSLRLGEMGTLRDSLEQTQQEAARLATELEHAHGVHAEVRQELNGASARLAALQTELDDARRTTADRAAEIERLKNQLHEANHQRDAADRWGQAKDTEAGELRKSLDTLEAETNENRAALKTLRAEHADQDHALTALRASYESLETEHARLERLLPGLRHEVRAARRQARELAVALSRRPSGGDASARGRERQLRRLRLRLGRIDEAEKALEALAREGDIRRETLAAVRPSAPEADA
jgi:chromosome segregation ATPase